MKQFLHVIINGKENIHLAHTTSARLSRIQEIKKHIELQSNLRSLRITTRFDRRGRHPLINKQKMEGLRLHAKRREEQFNRCHSVSAEAEMTFSAF